VKKLVFCAQAEAAILLLTSENQISRAERAQPVRNLSPQNFYGGFSI
jgi:hypothetical protein